MPDITKGYTFSDSKADWASQKDTAIRLNKMIDEAKVNITAGSGISVARTGGNIQVSATGSGGTVTNVSVVTANGVSGTVANPTTTPAITLALGAITPTSVAASGSVTGSNLSGTNTGDQTITLTGDVTGSGTGSFAATIANDAVTNSKLANVATATIKGRVSASTGDPEDLTGTQATTLLDTFTSSLKGLAPASGGGTTNFLRADGTWAAPAGGGGGTVTDVSVVTANGVSGTVANSTTTPAITLSLGAITPTSVAATGTVTGSNLSGTNTGDQTITLTGDVTGSGTGSFATTIANGVVTNVKLQNSAITIAGTSTSLGGSITLDTIDGLSANGLIARTSANTRAARTITGGTGITVTNGDGVSGNPTITATAVGVPTTGNQYSRLVKDISGTITSNSHMKWVGPDVYNVKDYGAAGNDSTDDTTAIGNAFDAAITNNGTVYFPQGVYKITSAISKTVTGRLCVIGAGRGSSVIRQYGSNADGLSLSVSNSKKQVLIQNLCIDARATAAGKAIYVDYTSNPSSQHNVSSITIDNVDITSEDVSGTKYSWANGIHFDWVHNGIISNTFIAGKDNNYIGKAISYTGVCVNNTIHNCQMNWWEYGIWFVNADSSFNIITNGSQRNHEGIFINQVWMVPVKNGLYVSGDANFYTSYTAGTFVVGATYRIATVGTTDFTLIGAANNNVGTEFVATGVGTGTGTAGISGNNGRDWDEGRITLVNMVDSHIDSRSSGYAVYIKNTNGVHMNSNKLIGESTTYLSRCYESTFMNNTFFTPTGYNIDFVAGTYGSSCVVAGNVFRGGSGVIIRDDNKYIKVYGNVAQLALDVTVSNTGNQSANNSVGTVGN